MEIDKFENFVTALKLQKNKEGISLFQHLCQVFGGMKFNPIKCLDKPYKNFEAISDHTNQNRFHL